MTGGLPTTHTTAKTSYPLGIYYMLRLPRAQPARPGVALEHARNPDMMQLQPNDVPYRNRCKHYFTPISPHTTLPRYTTPYVVWGYSHAPKPSALSAPCPCWTYQGPGESPPLTKIPLAQAMAPKTSYHARTLRRRSSLRAHVPFTFLTTLSSPALRAHQRAMATAGTRPEPACPDQARHALRTLLGPDPEDDGVRAAPVL